MPQHIERYKRGKDFIEVRRRQVEMFLLEHETIEDCVEAMLGRDDNVGPRGRLFALACVGLYLARGGREQALLALHRKQDFTAGPLDPDEYKMVQHKLASGYWNDVYLALPLQEGLPRVVVKIEYPLEERPQEEMDDELLRLKDEFLFLKKEYADAGLPDLIPNTQYLFATNPTTKKLAIAQIQTYVGDNPIDLMDTEPKNIERIRKLLRDDQQFRSDFEKFRTKTLELREKDNGMQEPDLAGLGNVLIVKEGERHVLRLVDPHRIPPSNAPAQRGQGIALDHLRDL